MMAAMFPVVFGVWEVADDVWRVTKNTRAWTA
jgi:hypothetical protein